MDFKKWDDKADLKGLINDVNEAKENGGGNFKEVPTGTYEVKVDKMELTESKKGNPMVTIWFEILTGEFKGSKIFYNQVITQGFQIHNSNELLRSLGTDLLVEFKSYSEYANLILNIHEAIDGKFEYALEYGENKNGYKTFEIKEVFELVD